MLDYVKTKSRQGIFFSKPEEKIHLPDGAELVMRCPDQRFLLKFIFQAGSFKTHSLETTQALLLSTWILFSSARSVNKSEKWTKTRVMKILSVHSNILIFSVHTQNKIMRGSTDNTVLHPKLTATMLRDHYVKELHQIKARGPFFN